MAESESRPIQVWLDPDEQRMFEALKEEDVRTTSDEVRWLIRREYIARQLESTPTPTESA